MKRKKIILTITLVTVFILAFWFISNKLFLPRIASFTPKDKAIDVPLDTTINIIFNSPLTEDQKNKVDIKITPAIETDSSWGQKQLNIAAKKGFETKTNYQVDVYYGSNKLTSFSFKTVLYTPQELLVQQQLQLAEDRAFSDNYTKIINQNPWLASLPIETPQYRIVYDFVKKSFRIRILVPTATDQEEQQLVNQALNDLKNIGVTQSFPSYYVLTQ